MKHQRLVRELLVASYRHQHRGRIHLQVIVANPAYYSTACRFWNRGQAGPARRARRVPRPARMGQPGYRGSRTPVRFVPAPPGWHRDPGPVRHRRARNDRGSHTGQDHEHQPGGAKTQGGRSVSTSSDDWYAGAGQSGSISSAPNPALPVPPAGCGTCRARIVARTCR